MITLNYKGVSLRIINTYEITKSSQNVTYSTIKCDFTGFNANDLPNKYQEVTILEDNNIVFFGYIDSYKFGEIRETDIYTEIEFTLLSPMAMATLRYTIANGTYKLNDLLPVLLEPLIDDGYTIVTQDIKNRQVTVNFPLDTIEYCMNNLSNKFNFWWFIDQYKQIHIRDIETMKQQEITHIYDNTHKLPYLQYIKPKMSSEGYANLVNFKNVRLYERANQQTNPLINLPISTMKKDSNIDFNYPIDIKAENIIKSAQSNAVQGNTYYGLYISGTYSNGNTFTAYVKVEDGQYSISDNIGFDGNENAIQDILLIRDSFFNNLITGFKFNNENYNLTSITIINSDSALIWDIMRIYNDKEITDKQGIISKSGIIEKTIDMSETWRTRQELTEIGSSYIRNNSLKLDGTIEMKFDTTCSIDVGDVVYINKMLFDDVYIVTKKYETIVRGMKTFLLTCKNGNMLNNFVDVFRRENEQENENKTYKISITHYIEEEIRERFEVVQ